jgi:hypothetical protein
MKNLHHVHLAGQQAVETTPHTTDSGRSLRLEKAEHSAATHTASAANFADTGKEYRQQAPAAGEGTAREDENPEDREEPARVQTQARWLENQSALHSPGRWPEVPSQAVAESAELQEHRPAAEVEVAPRPWHLAGGPLPQRRRSGRPAK